MRPCSLDQMRAFSRTCLIVSLIPSSGPRARCDRLTATIDGKFSGWARSINWREPLCLFRIGEGDTQR